MILRIFEDLGATSKILGIRRARIEKNISILRALRYRVLSYKI